MRSVRLLWLTQLIQNKLVGTNFRLMLIVIVNLLGGMVIQTEFQVSWHFYSHCKAKDLTC